MHMYGCETFVAVFEFCLIIRVCDLCLKNLNDVYICMYKHIRAFDFLYSK